MADNETIADIIAEMRGIRVREFQDYADRLDRARMKMEIEIANLRKENAKLREALVDNAKLRYKQGGGLLHFVQGMRWTPSPPLQIKTHRRTATTIPTTNQ